MIDTQSATWADVTAHAEAQIAAARRCIEAPDTDHLTTQYQRGRLAALREIADLPSRQTRTVRVTAAASY